MVARPKFKLSRLREIGWTEWNPIDLNRADTPDDEYDAYLLQAAGRLWNGASEEAVGAYLADIEASDMGLGHGFGIKLRALATARELHKYVRSLRGQCPLRLESGRSATYNDGRSSE